MLAAAVAQTSQVGSPGPGHCVARGETVERWMGVRSFWRNKDVWPGVQEPVLVDRDLVKFKYSCLLRSSYGNTI